MNRENALAVVLTAILVVSVFGGTAFGVAAMTTDTTAADTGDDPTAIQEQDDAQNETVSIVEAMEAAENETNATVVGANRGEEDGGFLDGGGELVYTVDAVQDDGTHLEVDVNATNGSVVEVGEPDDGFFEGIFGEDNVPDRPLNLSAMYSAIEAVEIAQNETDANGTVVGVNLDSRNDTLVYEVQMESEDDGQRTVVVSAMEAENGVIETETGDGE